MTPERLKLWRKARGQSQKVAASECLVSLRAWSEWERGKNRIPGWMGHVLRSVGDGLTPYK